MKNNNEFLRSKPSNGNQEQVFAAFNKIFMFSLILLGLWFSSQYYAYLLSYDPEYVGFPFYIFRDEYPIYYPWLYLEEVLENYREPEFWAILKAALWPWLVMSILAVIIYTFLTYLRGFKQQSENIMGTARWAKIKDLLKDGLLQQNGGVVFGQLANAKVNALLNKDGSVSLNLLKPSKIISQIGITNSLLAAPTRAGKGVSTGITTCVSYPGHIIVLDYKGENFEKTSGFRSKLGPVYRYAPVSDIGHHFNPLMEIRGGKDAYGDANMIADTLTTPSAGKSSSDANSEHFREAALELLTGVILHVLCSDYKNKSLPGVKDFLSSVNPEAADDDTYFLTQMIKSEHTTPEIHERVVAAAGNQLKRESKERTGVLSTVNTALRVFEDTRVRENSSGHDFYLDEFVTSKKPVSLYLTMPYAHVSRLAPLMRLFVMILIRRLSDGETRHDERKLQIPLLFILDEFDKLGKFNELQEAMGILAGFGVHFLLIVQSVSQLVAIYGRNHQFFAHCKNIVFFAPGEIESGKIISETVGKESIWKANTSTSGSRFSVGLDNLNISGSEIGRDLINADEVMKLPPDQMILLTQGRPPYIGKKCVYYQDERFKNRILKPAYSTRKEALLQCAYAVAKEKQRKWFELPLFTCLESYHEVVVEPRLIDPRLNPEGAALARQALETTNTVDGVEADKKITALKMGI